MSSPQLFRGWNLRKEAGSPHGGRPRVPMLPLARGLYAYGVQQRAVLCTVPLARSWMRCELKLRETSRCEPCLSNFLVTCNVGRLSSCRVPGRMHRRRRCRQRRHFELSRVALHCCKWIVVAHSGWEAMIDQGKPYVYRFRVPFDRLRRLQLPLQTCMCHVTALRQGDCGG